MAQRCEWCEAPLTPESITPRGKCRNCMAPAPMIRARLPAGEPVGLSSYSHGSPIVLPFARDSRGRLGIPTETMTVSPPPVLELEALGDPPTLRSYRLEIP